MYLCMVWTWVLGYGMGWDGNWKEGRIDGRERMKTITSISRLLFDLVSFGASKVPVVLAS